MLWLDESVRYKGEVMKVSVILGHPNLNSFNHAIAEAAVNTLKSNGHEVFFHDLYEEKFDPVVTGFELVNYISIDDLVEQHCREIKEADGIVIIHPNWWGQPPGILKGWIDRVLRPGTAYSCDKDENGKVITKGILKANFALVFNTSNTSDEREFNVLGDPLESVWRKCTFNFCGVEKFYKKIFSIVEDSTVDQRSEWLMEVHDIVNNYFPGESIQISL
jgi:putative NADPH-quinone reductase